ncbi:MAG: hypothetical protein ACI4SL_05525, partial [Candidatus Ornithospirochaeta sp.]
RDHKKIIAIFLVLLAIVTSNAFAATDVLPSIIKNIVTYIFGYALGGILLIKFGVDLATAVFRKDQDPSAIKKAIIGFVITLVVVLAWQPILSTILSGNTGSAVAGTGGKFIEGLLQETTTT